MALFFDFEEVANSVFESVADRYVCYADFFSDLIEDEVRSLRCFRARVLWLVKLLLALRLCVSRTSLWLLGLRSRASVVSGRLARHLSRRSWLMMQGHEITMSLWFLLLSQIRKGSR